MCIYVNTIAKYQIADIAGLQSNRLPLSANSNNSISSLKSLVVLTLSAIILLATLNVSAESNTAKQRFFEIVNDYGLADEKSRKGGFQDIDAKAFEKVINDLDLLIPDLKGVTLGRALVLKASCYYWLHLSKGFADKSLVYDPTAPPDPLLQEGLSYALEGREILEQYPAGVADLPWADGIVKKLGGDNPPVESETISKSKEKLGNEAPTEDRIISDVANQLRTDFPSLALKHAGKEVEFFILDNTNKTDNCRAFTHNLETPKIICNANLFYEIEAVIRSFLINQSGLPNESYLFSLAQKIQEDPHAYLSDFRKSHGSFKDTTSLDNQVIEQMKLVMLFLLAHELGHVKDALEGREFINILDHSAPLEQQVTASVVRMCRHVEDFDKLGYGLPFMKEAADLNSDIRKVEQKFREPMLIAYENHNQWYKDEVSADKFATSVMTEQINDMKKKQALESEHYLISNLFFMSIYYLYKDLYNFSTKACGGPVSNSSALSICMAKRREQYVKAASVFGDVHMFFLLRSILAIEEIMEQRGGYFRDEGGINSIWVSQEEFQKMDAGKQTVTFWHYANLQKYVLLSILTDTPVKFAYIGCSTGWLKEIDQKRGRGQMLLMNFETIEQAYQRLLRIP